MRIALLTSILIEGGAARVMMNMANAWANAGHTVTLFSFETGAVPPSYPLDQRVGIVYLNLNRHSPTLAASLANNLERMRKIRHSILAARPDVVISFIDTANVRVVLSLLGSGVPVIVSERVHPRHEHIGSLWEVLRRIAYRLAAGLVVQTEDIREHCRGWSRRIWVVPNPVFPLAATGSAPVLPRPAVLAVGRLYPQKAYGLLFEAFTRASAGHPEWTLCIAGRGEQQAALERQIQDLGMVGRICLLGQVEDVGGLLAQADVYALSSKYEGFPNALSEALAAGVACVATDCPSGPALLIHDMENGLLVPNHDGAGLAEALERLLSDAGLRQRLGAKAVEVSERFSLERIMGLWDAVVDETLGRRARNQ
jgi:glycosyltransferase involved in cell wall biosynthesis